MTPVAWVPATYVHPLSRPPLHGQVQQLQHAIEGAVTGGTGTGNGAELITRAPVRPQTAVPRYAQKRTR
jgi:hypothetical protein